MFSITFYFVKCSASHFPKENVQHLCFLQSKKHSIFALSRCTNILLVLEHFPLENVSACTFCYTKGYKCIFASHFPKENVQQSKMLESGQHKKQQTQHFCTVTMLTQCFFLVISYLTLFSIKNNLLTKSLLKIILVISHFGLFVTCLYILWTKRKGMLRKRCMQKYIDLYAKHRGVTILQSKMC